MPTNIASLLKRADLRDLSRPQMHFILALRLCAIGKKAGEDPLELMAVRFGSLPAAKAMLSLADIMGDSWPDPFLISRPCCMCMTPDELTAAHMLGAAGQADKAAFTSICKDLLAAEHHDGIYYAMVEFVGKLCAVLAQAERPIGAVQ